MAPISPKGNLKAHAEPKGKPKAKETELKGKLKAPETEPNGKPKVKDAESEGEPKAMEKKILSFAEQQEKRRQVEDRSRRTRFASYDYAGNVIGTWDRDKMGNDVFVSMSFY